MSLSRRHKVSAFKFREHPALSTLLPRHRPSAAVQQLSDNIRAALKGSVLLVFKLKLWCLHVVIPHSLAAQVIDSLTLKFAGKWCWKGSRWSFNYFVRSVIFVGKTVCSALSSWQMQVSSQDSQLANTKRIKEQIKNWRAKEKSSL